MTKNQLVHILNRNSIKNWPQTNRVWGRCST